MHPAVAVGIDVGTGGVRAVVCDGDGEELSVGTAGYPVIAPRPGWAEQDPQRWWSATCEAVRQALSAAGDAVRVVGVGLSGQMHGTVLLDERLQPLGNALLWCDGRAVEEVRSVVSEVGRESLIALTGNAALPGFTAPQLRWLAHADARRLHEARWAVCAKDYIRARLTGALATDHSDASGTGLYSYERGGWSRTLADIYGVDMEMLAPIHESSECVGRISSGAAQDTGLPAGTPVAAGAGDNAAAALGTGVHEPGELMISVGTSGTVLAPVAAPAPDPTGRCHLFRHALPGRWYSMAVVLSAGGGLSWWAGVTGAPIDALARAAEAQRPGSDGVIALPYLSGRRMPRDEPLARATITGLALAHGPSHISRALIEGAAYAIADGVGCLRDLGEDASRAVVTGGAAGHRVWRQALTLALPRLTLSRAARAEGAALGAALLGFAAAGRPLTAAGAPIARTPLLAGERGPSDEDFAVIAAGYRRFRELSERTPLGAGFGDEDDAAERGFPHHHDLEEPT
jgi:xylulokinase